MKDLRKYLFFKYLYFLLEPVNIQDLLQFINKYDFIQIISHGIIDDIPKNFVCSVKKNTRIRLYDVDDKDIFYKFHKTTRNEIHKSYTIDNLNFIIFNQDDKKFEEFYALYRLHENSQGRLPENKKNFYGYQVCAAIFKNQMISAVSFCETGLNIIRVKSISSLRLETEDVIFKKIISLSSRRVIWEICQYGKQRDCRFVDLAYVSLTGLRSGIDHFKLSFGGEIIDDYTYIYKSYKYLFMEHFLFLVLKIKKVYYLFLKK
jgi:hypothetical protein